MINFLKDLLKDNQSNEVQSKLNKILENQKTLLDSSRRHGERLMRIELMLSSLRKS